MIESLLYKIKKNDYSFFLLKLAFLFLIVFSVDFILGNILRHFYFKQESGTQYRTMFAMEKARADVWVFGSSRANHHYQPEIFKERLKGSYYNAGKDGSSILYHYAVLKSVLKRHQPKLIILDLMSEEFKTNPESYDRLATLLPYYKDHPEIRPVVKLKSEFEQLKLLSQIYPFNSSTLTIAAGNAEFNKTRRRDEQGYVALENVWVKPIITQKYREYETDTIKIDAYTSFIKDCIANNIKLYVVVSPYFIKNNFKDHSISIGKAIAERHQVKFYDFSDHPDFIKNPGLFDDPLHLNDKGAKIFTGLLIDQIKP